MPRWSVPGLAESSAASIAGLPASSACVWVGPPLSASGPMPADPEMMSLVAGLPLGEGSIRDVLIASEMDLFR